MTVTKESSGVAWQVCIALSLFATAGRAFNSPYPGPQPARAITTKSLWQATSSRDLKERNPSILQQRLARATAQAQARQKQLNLPVLDDGAIGDLKQLNQVIDTTLAKKRRNAMLYGTEAKNSMLALLDFGVDGGDDEDDDSDELATTGTVQVVVVFGKSLIRNQITVEYASRLQRLLRFIADGEVDPHIICFCGGTSPGNQVSNADAGFVFFQHMLSTHHDAPLTTEFFLDRTSQNEEQALHNVVAHIKKQHLAEWLAISQDVVMEHWSRARKRVQVHFTLISTDYHLCNLNDIHRQSPKQSCLRPLQTLEVDDLGIIETSWSFCYATYPFKHATLETVAFMGRCYFLSEQLLPLLMNMRGVVNGEEFFQRENYLVLASVRRGLVEQMESLYQKSTALRTGLRQMNALKSAETVDVVLEGALLSLGRCIDLVRPAGLHVSPVSKSDYAKALRSLEHCMGQIRAFSDPDQPLPPTEWGKLDPTVT